MKLLVDMNLSCLQFRKLSLAWSPIPSLTGLGYREALRSKMAETVCAASHGNSGTQDEDRSWGGPCAKPQPLKVDSDDAHE
jgi:hypothetical protein